MTRLITWRRDDPPAAQALARRRVAPLVRHYGENLETMPITALAASAYMQGLDDAFAIDRPPPPGQPHRPENTRRPM